jgi:hypothetical protein
MKNKLSVPFSVHPDYLSLSSDWEKFRSIKDGGDQFIEDYLVTFSSREEDTAFTNRKSITPIPGFASAALIDIRNSIYQRLSDIARVGGSTTYQKVVKGELGGVDLNNSTMDSFIGRDILTELLFLGKVGVFVDMPAIPENQTKREANQVRPYFYSYSAEQIRNWTLIQTDNGIEFERLLLEENHLNYDSDFGLPLDEQKRYRFLTKENGVVTVRFYNSDNEQIDENGQPTDESIILNITRIPFILFELEHSMLQDIANHQIALLNMCSADIQYSLLANFPFYTEQQSGLQGSHLKSEEGASEHEGDDADVGSIQGRRYGKGLDRPGFIHPSSEPLKASMEKQAKLVDDIRALVNLAMSQIRPKYSSAESKEMDKQGLEAGLSFLGLVLEHGERQLTSLWQEYEGDKSEITIIYPERYNLKSDEQRIKESQLLTEQMAAVPSKIYQKIIAKQITKTLLDSKVSNETIIKITKEIDEAEYISSSPEAIHQDIERGILSLETGAIARGYNANEPKKAAKDHAERIARIKMAQESDDPVGQRIEKQESQNPDIQEHGQKATRGEKNV